MTDATQAAENQGGNEEVATKSLSLLASEAFGSEFKGEVKPDEEPKKEDSEQEVKTEGTSETTDDVEELQTKEEGEESTEDGTETDKSEDEGENISNVNELAEFLETDKEFIDGLKVPVTVNAQTSEVPIKDLVANYQMNQAADERLEQAKTKAKAQEQELVQKSEALEGQFQIAAELIKSAEAVIDRDVQDVDWAKLREEDPAEFSARKQDIAERRAGIERMKQEALSAYQQTKVARTKDVQDKLQQRLQAEQAALLEKLPDWADPKVADAEKTKLADYLVNQGYSKDEISNSYDHRSLIVARKAMLYDEGQIRVETAKKRVKKVPKMMKPGAAKSPDHVNQEKLKQATGRLRKTGNINDALALLQAKRGK